MWLIEYSKGCYINAETIEHIGIRGGVINFTTTCDPEGNFVVEGSMAAGFTNHVNALNSNICCKSIKPPKESEDE